MILNSVDLPQPDGPMIEKNSPAWTSKETSFSAGTCSLPLSAEPKTMLTLRKVNIAIDLVERRAIRRAPTNRRIQPRRQEGLKATFSSRFGNLSDVCFFEGGVRGFLKTPCIKARKNIIGLKEHSWRGDRK